jgi:hypothetical protein
MVDRRCWRKFREATSSEEGEPRWKVDFGPVDALRRQICARQFSDDI